MEGGGAYWGGTRCGRGRCVQGCRRGLLVRASILAQIAPFHAQLLLKETPSAEEAAKTLMAMPVAPRMSLLSAMDLPSKQRCLRGLAEVEEAAWVGGNATMSPGMRVTDSGWLPARKEACKQEEDP